MGQSRVLVGARVRVECRVVVGSGASGNESCGACTGGVGAGCVVGAGKRASAAQGGARRGARGGGLNYDNELVTPAQKSPAGYNRKS